MRSVRVLTASVLGAAALAGPASAMPGDPPHLPARPAEPTAPPVVESDGARSGFDWSSAGIGAAAGVGAFAIALAGAAGRQRRRSAEPRTLATH